MQPVSLSTLCQLSVSQTAGKGSHHAGEPSLSYASPRHRPPLWNGMAANTIAAKNCEPLSAQEPKKSMNASALVERMESKKIQRTHFKNNAIDALKQNV